MICVVRVRGHVMLWPQRRRGVGLRADRSGAAGLARRIALAARRRMRRVGELLAQVRAVREAVDPLRAASRGDGNRRLARRGVKRPRPPGHTPGATLRARVVGAGDAPFRGGPGLVAAAAGTGDLTVRGDARLNAIPSLAGDRARRDSIALVACEPTGEPDAPIERGAVLERRRNRTQATRSRPRSM